MKKKRYKKIGFIISALCFILILALLITWVVKQKFVPPSQPPDKQVTRVEIDAKKNGQPATENDFFPEQLDLKKIYSLIRIKKGNYYFRDELPTLILNQVISNGSFVNGELSYWYHFKQAKKQFIMNFKWVSSSGAIQGKTYTIKLAV